MGRSQDSAEVVREMLSNERWKRSRMLNASRILIWTWNEHVCPDTYMGLIHINLRIWGIWDAHISTGTYMVGLGRGRKRDTLRRAVEALENVERVIYTN